MFLSFFNDHVCLVEPSSVNVLQFIMHSCHFMMLPLACSRDSFVSSSMSSFPTVACVSLNFASLVSTFCAKSTSSSCHGWVTLMNSVSSSHGFYSWIFSFLLLCDCTIRYTRVRPAISFFSFAISASAYCISSRTSSIVSICSIPNHDDVVVSSKCVVSSIWCTICPVISLAATFNCLIGSLSDQYTCP